MKRFKFLIKYSWVFLVTLLPQFAFADTPFQLNTFTPPATDYSLGYLREIFGHVGSALMGTQQTIIGELFGVFNAGILSIVGIFLMYTTIRSIVDTAHEGQVMGKKMSPWMVGRVVVGVGALVPKFSGYSLIQVFVMWAVVQGVGLADHAWNMALTYLQHGGVIYTNEATAGKDAANAQINLELVDAVQGNPGNPNTMDPTKAGSVDVLRSLVCMHALEQTLQKKQDALKNDVINNPQNYVPGGDTNSTQYKQLLNSLNNTVNLKVKYDEKHGVAYFPEKRVIGGTMAGQKAIVVSAGRCGAYNWSVAGYTGQTPPLKPGDNAVAKNQYALAKESGLKQMALDLDPSAKTIVHNNYNNADDSKDYTGYDAIVTNAALDYQTIIYSSRLYAGSNYGSHTNSYPASKDGICACPDGSSVDAGGLCYNGQKPPIADSKGMCTNNFYGEAERGGWSTAGRYYYTLSEISNLGALDTRSYRIAIANNQYPPQSPEGLSLLDKSSARSRSFLILQDWLNKQDFAVKPLKDSLTDADQINSQAYIYAENFNKNEIAKGNQTSKDAANALHNVAIFKSSDSLQKTINFSANTVTLDILQHQITNVVKVWQLWMVDPGHNQATPIIKLANVGDQLIKSAKGVWESLLAYHLTAGIVASVADTAASITAIAIGGTGTPLGIGSGAAAATASGVTNVVGMVFHIIESTISMQLPLVIGVTTPMFITGIMLSVYTPFIPFMIFTFAVIGWLIFVIEAMAAAPLVALGITHPEGHDLLGKAEQAVMLLFSVFLRPICMIIGLVAAIVLSHVALTILNVGFGGLVADFSHASDLANMTGMSFKVITILLIYTFMVVAIVNQCFALIHLVPEKVMRWLGLHPEGSNIPQLMESVKGGVTPFAQGAAKQGEMVPSSKAIGQGVSAGAGQFSSNIYRPRPQDFGKGNDKPSGATPKGKETGKSTGSGVSDAEAQARALQAAQQAQTKQT